MTNNVNNPEKKLQIIKNERRIKQENARAPLPKAIYKETNEKNIRIYDIKSVS